MSRVSTQPFTPSFPALRINLPARMLAIALAVVMLLVAFAALIDMALTVNRMSASLVTVNGTLRQVSLKLTLTNELLHATNAKVLTTNRKLDLTNATAEKSIALLSGMARSVGRTNARLAKTNASLAGMRFTLGTMGSDIGAMTRKITRAKLLF